MQIAKALVFWAFLYNNCSSNITAGVHFKSDDFANWCSGDEHCSSLETIHFGNPSRSWENQVTMVCLSSSTKGEHPRGLFWLSWIFLRTPLLLWPLSLTLIVMLPSSVG